MRRFLSCALLVVAGCGESEEAQGTTFVGITPPDLDVTLEAWFSCWDDPWGDTEFNTDSGEYEWLINPRPGPCALLIGLRDHTGERICVQEEDFVVSEVGDTEVHFTVDDCECMDVDSGFESFEQSYSGGPCLPEDDCQAFTELRADGLLRLDRWGEPGGPVHEVRVSAVDLADAVAVFTNPALVDFLAEDPLARCGTVDSVEVMELVLADGSIGGVTTLCEDAPLRAARAKLWELAATYFGADVFGRPLSEL